MRCAQRARAGSKPSDDVEKKKRQAAAKCWPGCEQAATALRAGPLCDI